MDLRLLYNKRYARLISADVFLFSLVFANTCRQKTITSHVLSIYFPSNYQIWDGGFGLMEAIYQVLKRCG